LKAKDIAVLAIWVFTTLAAGSAVDAENYSYLVSRHVADVPAVWQILGEARSIASNVSILQADLYMHGGAGHFFEEHEGGMALSDGCKGEHHHDEKIRLAVSPFNVLFRLSGAISVSEHKHLEGAQVREIIPWLSFAARLDPNNIMAYTLTAFWLGDRLGAVDEAVMFLKEGLKNNPGSWEINTELGRVYYQRLKDPVVAQRYLLRAKSLLKGVDHDRYNERYVLAWLVAVYEQEGKKAEAVATYKQLKALFPETTVYDAKIRRIEGELAGNGER
jgi:tetratricopeptide (TPR) repeat protein